MKVIGIPRQIGQAVRTRRVERGLTQVELAQRSGVSVRFLGNLEIGCSTGFQTDKVLAVLQALGLSLLIASDEEIRSTPSVLSPSPIFGEEPAHEDTRSPEAAYNEAFSKMVERMGRSFPVDPAITDDVDGAEGSS